MVLKFTQKQNNMHVKDFLKSKNICLFSSHSNIISDDNKLHALSSLLEEYAKLYSKKYLCYSKIIDLIDESENLKELEININRYFNEK